MIYIQIMIYTYIIYTCYIHIMFILMVYNLAKKRLNLQEIYHLTTEETPSLFWPRQKTLGIPVPATLGSQVVKLLCFTFKKWKVIWETPPGTEINGSNGSIYDIYPPGNSHSWLENWKSTILMVFTRERWGMFMGELLVSGRVLYMYTVCVFLWYLFKPPQTPKYPKSSLGQNSSHVGQVGPQKTAELQTIVV